MQADFAVILAAGRGTRMKSTLAKVLHPLLGKPMVAHVAASAERAGLRPVLVWSTTRRMRYAPHSPGRT